MHTFTLKVSILNKLHRISNWFINYVQCLFFPDISNRVHTHTHTRGYLQICVGNKHFLLSNINFLFAQITAVSRKEPVTTDSFHFSVSTNIENQETRLFSLAEGCSVLHNPQPQH